MNDLLLDLQELETLLVRGHYDLIVSRSARLRGRIERFKHQFHEYNPLTRVGLAGLDAARIQLVTIGNAAARWPGLPENRAARIQKAIALVSENLNRVLGIENIGINED